LPPSAWPTWPGLLKGIGVQRVDVADTIGVGTPRKVQRAIEATLQHYGWTRFGPLSRHLRPGAVQHAGRAGAGVWNFQSSVAGLGGCPYAKGATGNVATEDVVYMLHGMGIDRH
jgi:hydroxymethylglutaryl-CoA lyase